MIDKAATDFVLQRKLIQNAEIQHAKIKRLDG